MLSSIEALERVTSQRATFLQQSCKKLNATIADWKIVNFLKEDCLTITDLVNLSGLDISTLSRQVKHALQKEFIAKEARLEDQRRLYFSLTAKGQELKLAVNSQLNQFDEKLFTNWSKEELAMFNILINRVVKKVIK